METKYESGSLVLSQHIIGSDDDAPVYASVSAGFAEDKSLVTELDFTDYRNRSRDSRTVAVVSAGDAGRMAGKLGCTILSLPEKIKDRFGTDDYTLYSVSDVKAAFKDILDFLSDCGIRYTLID